LLLKKENIAKPSSDKYVSPHRRHLSQEGKNFVLCENANLKIVEPIKKHFSKQRQPTCHHCGVIGHIRPPVIRSDIRSFGSRSKSQRQVSLALNLPSLIMLLGKKQYPQRGSPSCCHSGKNGHTKAKYFREMPRKPKEI
jgi:hypothetical protein